jgi:hypothetical protein
MCLSLQIRRMFASLGYEVESLHRHTIGSLTLGDTREGDWRFCTAEDLAAVFGGPQVDPAAGMAQGDATSSSRDGNDTRGASSSSSSSSDSSEQRDMRVSVSRQKASSRSREALAAGQLWEASLEELVVDSAYDVEDEDGMLQQEQLRTSKRYRDSTRFKQRRATLKQRLAAAGADRDP